MKYKILYISPLGLLEICKRGFHHVQVVANDLPQDTKYIRSFVDGDTSGWGRIGIVIESESFDELKEGDVIPVLLEPVFEKIQQNQVIE